MVETGHHTDPSELDSNAQTKCAAHPSSKHISTFRDAFATPTEAGAVAVIRRLCDSKRARTSEGEIIG